MKNIRNIFLVMLLLAINVGLAALSSGISMRFEAEYASSEHVNYNDGNSDRFFYMSPRCERVGYHERRQEYSNRHRWAVDDGTSGYAYKDIIPRWQGANAYHKVGERLGILTNPPKDARLSVSYVFRVDELEKFKDTDALAVFSFVSHRDDSGTNYSMLHFYHESEPTPTREYSLTKGEYLKLPIVDRVVNLRAIEFTFDIGGDGSDADYSLVKQGVMKANGGHLGIDNLNPWMYWNGKGKLKLDYVEYKVR